MRLSSEFIRLPLAFDAKKLAEEALQFSEDEWDKHPTGFIGNTALSLVSTNGERNNAYTGRMQPTPALAKCPYIQTIMASFKTVIARSRFMRLAPGAQVPRHSDVNYTWRKRIRIHIPIITHPDVIFSSTGNIDIHMQAGECWIFDNWKQHAVYNNSSVDRIHLVIDTVGTAEFWNIVEQGWNPQTPIENWNAEITTIPDHHKPDQSLLFESYNVLPVQSPDEIENMMAEFLDEISHLKTSAPDIWQTSYHHILRFQQDWRGLWAAYWDEAEHIPKYQALAERLKATLKTLLGDIKIQSVDMGAFTVIGNWLGYTTDTTPVSRPSETIKPALPAETIHLSPPTFHQPIFIMAAPRSGSTMLFEALKKNQEFWTIGDESHREIESIPALNPAHKNYASNNLEAADCTSDIKEALENIFTSKLQNALGASYSDTPANLRPTQIRFLEKTPKNALRIPFFKKMYPDAKFIFLHRDAKANIGSIIDAWQSQRFVTYPNLPGWAGLRWSLILTQGWEQFAGRPLEEIAAWQWATTNKKILEDLTCLPAEDRYIIRYEDLLENPQQSLQNICQYADVPYGPRMQAIADSGFPQSRYTLTAPEKEKWRKHEEKINRIENIYAPIATALDNIMR